MVATAGRDDAKARGWAKVTTQAETRQIALHIGDGSAAARLRSALLTGGLALGAALLTAQSLRAEETGGTAIVSHGIATFNNDPLKHAADITHLPYVNPDAPIGGTVKLAKLPGYVRS